ncbi:WI12 domain-containing protein [Cephalotus follicularis]|uniref:WI12 domain-containing protein n=1 Tax=Cephalotus follicularis TaxID=3775 RepID=A0A1Q3CKS8_CEPFO|nr:WI12 domain-containing protein [Cephalotus follicularis]
MEANNHKVISPEPDSDSKQEMQNIAMVEALYEALTHGQTATVAKLLASDLEWWFHGPPQRQHMMRMLTGESSHIEFKFEPRSIEVFGGCVIAEGWEGAQAYWVHVWILKDGLITQFREYFNTWLTVKDLKPLRCEIGHESHTLWQSQPRDLARRSLPGLLLAI